MAIITDIEDKHIQGFELEDRIHDGENVVGCFYKNAGIVNLINIHKQYDGYKGKDVDIEEFGRWHIDDIVPKQEQVSCQLKIFDLSYKFDGEYDESIATFPCTNIEWAEAICNHVGVPLGSTSFPNSEFVLEKQPFLNEKATYRDAIKMIAASGGCFAKVHTDNRLYIRWFEETTIEIEDWFELLQEPQTKPINVVVLGRGDVEDNIKYPTTTPSNPMELRIDNNQILYYNREQMIVPIYNQINGFKFFPFKMRTSGRATLRAGMKVKYTDIDGLEVTTPVMYHKITYNGGIGNNKSYSSNIESYTLKETSTNYEYAGTIEKRVSNAEIAVNKQNKKIEAVVSDVGEQNEKISKVTQTVDELRSQISEVAEMTTSADGYGSVSLSGINESEPIRVVVRPVGEDIAYLYPRSNLYPSNDLYLKNRKLRFATSKYSIDWELPADLLYYDAENYDELILDYEGQSCVVNKKVGYNADGSKYLLEKPTTISYSYPKIPLETGDYTVTVLGYVGAYLFVRLMAQNMYTTQFATRAEMNSAITQTVQEIDLSVNKKLSNYSTTTQMNAAINLKSDSIISSVSSTYSTKTETATAKSEAISSANSSTDNKLKNYSTTVQMNSAITQKANEITSTVSATYATKTQLSTAKSEIKQTTDSISAEVTKKVNNSDYTSAQILLKINNDTSETLIKSNKVDLSGYVTITNLKTAGKTTINGSNITTGTIDASKVTVKNLNASNITSGTISASKISGGSLNLTGTSTTITSTNFSVDKDGNLTANNATLKGTIQAGSTISGATIEGSSFKVGDNNEFYVDKNGTLQCKVLKIIGERNTSVTFYVYSEETGRKVQFTSEAIMLNNGSSSSSKVNISNNGTNGHIYCSGAIEARGSSGTVSADAAMYATNFINTSESKLKENIIKFVDKLKESVLNTKSATDILKEAEICEFNYLGQQEKTIGVVIGNEYKTPKEIIKTKIEEDGSRTKGVDLYSMVSLAWQAIQELVSRIEKLERM